MSRGHERGQDGRAGSGADTYPSSPLFYLPWFTPFLPFPFSPFPPPGQKNLIFLYLSPSPSPSPLTSPPRSPFLALLSSLSLSRFPLPLPLLLGDDVIKSLFVQLVGPAAACPVKRRRSLSWRPDPPWFDLSFHFLRAFSLVPLPVSLLTLYFFF